MSNLPETGFWKQKDNPVEKLLWGRAKIEHASAFLFFEKGSSVQNIFHHFKYRGKKEIGYLLGRMYASKLKDSFFSEIDLIIPVPLHKKKLRKRGYNQSLIISQGLSEILEKPVNNTTLSRKKFTSTQTKKSRYDRWLNVKDIFSVENESLLENKHILLVDDIITTGATTESLIHTLTEIPGIKISVVALAVA